MSSSAWDVFLTNRQTWSKHKHAHRVVAAGSINEFWVFASLFKNAYYLVDRRCRLFLFPNQFHDKCFTFQNLHYGHKESVAADVSMATEHGFILTDSERGCFTLFLRGGLFYFRCWWLSSHIFHYIFQWAVFKYIYFLLLSVSNFQ